MSIQTQGVAVRSRLTIPSFAVGPWGLLALMTVLNILSFLDRQLLASTAAFVVPELGLTNTQFGLLTGLAFVTVYVVSALIIGPLADRLHRPRLLAAALAVWSAATIATGFASSFIGLLIPRAIVGIGEAVLQPSALSMLSERFPKQRLGTMNGVFILGIPVGVALSFIVAGVFGPTLGWRSAFYATGVIGFVAVAVLIFVRENPNRIAQEHRAPAVRPSQQARDVWRVLRASPALVAATAGLILAQLPLGATAFEQLWFVKERGLDVGFSALMVGAIAITTGIAGGLIGGGLGDAWYRRTGIGRTMIPFVFVLIFFPLGIASRFVATTHLLFWMAPVVIFLSLGLLLAPVNATLQELTPVKMRATVIAAFITITTIGREILGTTASGVLADYFIGRGVDEPYTWTIVTFSCLGTLSAPLFLYSAIRFKRDKEAFLLRHGTE